MKIDELMKRVPFGTVRVGYNTTNRGHYMRPSMTIHVDDIVRPMYDDKVRTVAEYLGYLTRIPLCCRIWAIDGGGHMTCIWWYEQDTEVDK